jgi:hypothetical protein
MQVQYKQVLQKLAEMSPRRSVQPLTSQEEALLRSQIREQSICISALQNRVWRVEHQIRMYRSQGLKSAIGRCQYCGTRGDSGQICRLRRSAVPSKSSYILDGFVSGWKSRYDHGCVFCIIHIVFMFVKPNRCREWDSSANTIDLIDIDPCCFQTNMSSRGSWVFKRQFRFKGKHWCLATMH